AMPDDARLDTFLESFRVDDHALAGNAIETKASAEQAGLHAFPKGAAPGTFLHDLLEWAFRQGPRQILADPVWLNEQIVRRCNSRGWGKHAAQVTTWLHNFLTREFRPGGEGTGAPLVLADLTTALPEME